MQGALRTRQQARAKLWRRGILVRQPGKGHKAQRMIYETLQRTDQKSVWLNCSRRFGKSTLFLMMAVEHCLTVKRAAVRYAAPQKSDAEEIATDLMETVLEGCPRDLRPRYNRNRKEYTFPSTGAKLRFGGVNGDRAKYLRGRRATLIIVDEAGEMDDLRYVLKSILRPQLLTTKGRMLIASTPARSPGHESTAEARRHQARGEGAYFLFTIFDNPMLTAEQIAAECEEQGGPESDSWRREYLCQFVIDQARAIVPEWTDEVAAKQVQAVEPPRYRDLYVSIDPGGSRDLTFALGSWWDWRQQVLHFEWEWWARNPDTESIAKGILGAMVTHWPNQRPLRIVSDIDDRLQVDLAKYKLNVENAWKPDRDAGIADFRTDVRNLKVVVHPRCKLLISTLHQALWNKRRTDWERLDDIGHADALAAAIYNRRSVLENRNPVPPHAGASSETHHIEPTYVEISQEAQALIDAFNAVPGLE